MRNIFPVVWIINIGTRVGFYLTQIVDFSIDFLTDLGNDESSHRRIHDRNVIGIVLHEYDGIGMELFSDQENKFLHQMAQLKGKWRINSKSLLHINIVEIRERAFIRGFIRELLIILVIRVFILI